MGIHQEYDRKRVLPEKILGIIRPGSRVYIETGCVEPQYLVRSLIIKNKDLRDVELYTSIPLKSFEDFGGRFGSRFRLKSFFISPDISDAFAQGNADHMPVSTMGLTRLVSEGYIRFNVAIIQLGPMDKNGFMSMGGTVDITRSIIDMADCVIAQVNPRMPRAFGDGFVHIGHVDYVIENDEPLMEFPFEAPDPETQQVGKNIARLIEDGSTIQTGFGRIPEAALLAMDDKKDIGIHSEIITDAICDLVEKGVVTNEKKMVDRGKVVASFCLGTKRIMDFADNNPFVEFKGPEYVCDPQVIRRHHNMVAINGALEIDLTGQSCVGMSERLGYFGALGHAVFNRIAMFTPKGKGIIALRSTSRDGRFSRIVPEFTDSRIGIITTQEDINYVVTEYGCADLFGKSMRERALSLITLAHPRFRQSLLDEAKRLKYIYEDQMLPDGDAPYPHGYEMVKTFGTREVLIRPIRIMDERGIQDIFYAMNQHDKFYRFLRNVSVLHHQQAQPLVRANYRDSMALVVSMPSQRDGRIFAVAHFAREDKPGLRDTCEFAVMVHPNWQNIGIGSFLFTYLVDIARDLGFRRIRAYVWEDNAQMLRVFTKAGLSTRKNLSNHVYTLDMDLKGGSN
ncbi:MAG: GNAT family N-acetyltransferase [Thermodesulfobacteriota bacterium]|nr:GNAT family N-acetyltransferase [Thermodesulfobacteriota bacterium]